MSYLGFKNDLTKAEVFFDNSIVAEAFRGSDERKQDFITSTYGAVPEEIITELERMAYFMCPAGMKHHGAYIGGLYEHSKAVAKELSILSNKLGLTWQREHSPVIIGFFHDICKVYQYDIIVDRNEPKGYVINFNKDNIMPGHGELSINIIHKLEREYPGFSLTDEEKACIRYHMGAYSGKDEWDTLDAAIRMFPNIIYTHAADMIASKIIGK